MPFDRDVTIDFNADISGYSASMGQMIQQTSQYTAAADGMIGKIGKLNNVVMGSVKSLAAFTQTNKVATAQAAAYQQQLSKIEATAKVSNKQFAALEKTTKGLAKDFPIGMKQAVDQVEALQEAGVTSNKEISKLATTFTKMGAATGTFGPEMTKNMLQLNRTFQHSNDSIEKFGDSLVSVTAKYGANAGAVVQFSKAIAPVAATVGMSETSVIGLSTAFSRLGEDGYAAANTFNKVMLDMSKSIREGTPEAKIYAEVMGTTAKDLKSTWSKNPAEGFIEFVESIKKQGPDSIRSLEQLGLEGVRTQKTILSLANSGNLREIVEQAQVSYGGGSMGQAAETAMGGVNDEMTKLNETMAQTTATAGKPFLGFLEEVLKVANALSGALSDLVESPAIQGFAKIVGIAGGMWGLQKMMTSGAMIGSIGLSAVKGGARSGAGAALGAGLRGEAIPEGGRGGLAYRAGSGLNAILGGFGGAAPGGNLLSTLGGIAKGGANVLGNAMGAYWNSNASMMLKSIDREGITTPQGQKVKAAWADVNAIRQDKGIKDEAVRREAMSKATQNAIAETKAMATQAGGAGNAMKGFANQTRAAGAFWKDIGGSAARGGVKALGGVGNAAAGALGIGGLSAGAAAGLGAVGVAAGAGYLYYRGQKQEKEAIEAGGKDANAAFNDFAEKAGIATKELVSFAQALGESTSKIASRSDTSEEAMAITPEEMIQARTPGYERAYTTRGTSFWDKFSGGKDAQKEAVRIRGMLGADASPEAINRIQMDLLNQFQGDTSFVEDVMKEYGGLQGKSSEEVQGMLHNAGTKSRTWGIFGSKESSEFLGAEEAERARATKAQTEVKGQDIMTIEQFAGAEGALDKLNALKPKAGGTGIYGTQASVGTGLYGTSTDQMKAQREQTAATNELVKSLNLSHGDEEKVRQGIAKQQAIGGPMDMPSILKASGLEDLATVYQQGLVGEGIASGAGQYKNVSEEKKEELKKSETERLAEASTNLFKDASGEVGTLATELSGTNKIVRDSNQTFEEWNKGAKEGATDLQKAYADVVGGGAGDVTKQRRFAGLASDKAIEDAMRQGKGTEAALTAIESAMTRSTGAELPGLQQAYELTEAKRGITDFGMGTFQKQAISIQRGKEAEARLTGPEADTMTEEQRQIETQKAQEGIATQQQQMQQIQQFQIQQKRQQEDFNLQRSHMERDFQKSMAYQAEDYGRQRKYAIQDYHRGVERAEEDFYTQRKRAQRDFNKQMTRMAEDTAKNMMDPYQRMAPQVVTDMGVLQQSLLEQNQSLQQQLGSVDLLGKMGLSKEAINQLKLMDPTQNQQVQRLLSDAQTDPSAITKVNNLVKERVRLAGKLTTSEYNTDFQRQKEDFKQGMDDMSDDFNKNMRRGQQDFRRSLKRNGEAFATAQSRALEQHQTALNDMDEANARARDRAFQDLTGMGADYETNYAQIQADFLTDLANLPGDMSPATKKAIKKVLDEEAKAIQEANTAATNAGAGAASSPTANPYAMGSGGGPVGAPAMPGDSTGGGDKDMASFFLSRIGDRRMIGLGAGHKIASWHDVANACLMNVAWAKRYLGETVHHTGYPTAASVGSALKRDKSLHSGYGAPAGALYWWNSSIGGGAGHVAVSDGKGNAINNWGSQKVEKHRVNTMAPRAYQGWSTYSALAEGGIVNAPTRALIGEAGREAVIPLNDKGTRYLAESMREAGRYLNSTTAQTAQVAPHSTANVTYMYSYDHSTQITGPITVEAQDPDAMAKKLAARERRNRLARKTGSAA